MSTNCRREISINTYQCDVNDFMHFPFSYFEEAALIITSSLKTPL